MDSSRIVIVNDSLTISKLAYDINKRVLRIWFVSTGSVWDYHDVYPADFAKLASAYSVGEVFNARFRNRYKETKVEPEVVDTTKASKPKVQSKGSTKEKKMDIKAKKAVECKGSEWPAVATLTGTKIKTHQDNK